MKPRRTVETYRGVMRELFPEMPKATQLALASRLFHAYSVGFVHGQEATEARQKKSLETVESPLLST